MQREKGGSKSWPSETNKESGIDVSYSKGTGYEEELKISVGSCEEQKGKSDIDSVTQDKNI